jgi:hypothetical protein
MSTKNEQEPIEPADKADGNDDVKQGIARFAQYTSPIMLAMLTSAGKDMALAATT